MFFLRYFWILIFFATASLHAQVKHVCIEAIEVAGHKKTKTNDTAPPNNQYKPDIINSEKLNIGDNVFCFYGFGWR